MKKLCLKCYNVYDYNVKLQICGNYMFCPSACCIGNVVEIDDNIIDVIILLNQKGYKTEYCCSGHTYDISRPRIYIKFIYPYKLDDLPNDFNYKDKTLEYFIDNILSG